MMEKIWLSSPHMGGTEQSYVNEAFAENWIAPLGPNVNGFEHDIQKFSGTAHAAALSSGTGAIHIALDILGVGDRRLCISSVVHFLRECESHRILRGNTCIH